MSPSETTNKRPRPNTDEESGENVQVNPVRSADIWFEDGNLVLQAGNVQFKVHRSVLAMHSPIFVDVFGMPHPADEPTVDGCPLMHLQDSAEDIKHIVLVLYGSKDYSIPGPVSFSAISAMIRMGRKYEIPHLRDGGYARLATDLPTRTNKDFAQQLPRWTKVIPTPGILLDIINLAHEADIKSILPVAYYLLSMNVERVFATREHPDGSEVGLSKEVLQACILGREKILQRLKPCLFQWAGRVGVQGFGCEDEDQCNQGLSEWRSFMWYHELGPEVIFNHQHWENVLISQNDFCRTCMDNAKISFQNGKDIIWRELPTYFGLGDWTGLKDFDS